MRYHLGLPKWFLLGDNSLTLTAVAPAGTSVIVL